MNYEKDIRIDENSLDIEWLDQAQLMYRYAEHSAKCQLDRDRAKVKLDLVKADLDKRIRTHPERFGMEKVTEAAVTNAIISHNDYKEEQEAYLTAEYDANIAQAAVRAFDARKVALENLVRLHGQQYFAGPRIPRDLTSEREARQRKVDGGIAEKMKRKVS